MSTAAATARKTARVTRNSAATAGQLIPLAVGRTAGAVRQLPESGLVHRLTRGRVWIFVLGLLLIGIVALNVATLSFDASIGKMERQALDLEQRNSALRAGLAKKLSHDRVEAAALNLGLIRPATDQYSYRQVDASSASVAAERVAAAVTLAAESIVEPEVGLESAVTGEPETYVETVE